MYGLKSVVAVSFLTLSAACGGDAPAAPESPFTVRDSAGVQIVEARGEDWGGADAWSVDPEPLLTIGDDPGEELFRVRGAALLGDGSVAIGNRGTLELRVFGPSGELLRIIGGEGEGPGEFSSLFGMERIGDTIVAHEFFRSRLYAFSPDGDLLREVPFPRHDGALPISISTAASGHLVTYRSYPQGLTPDPTYVRRPMAFFVYGRDGGEGRLIAEMPGDEMVATRRTVAGSIVTTTDTPIMARGSFSVALPDRIVVATNDRFELHVYDWEGALRRIIRAPYRDRPVTDEDWDRAVRDAIESRVDADHSLRSVMDVVELVPPPDIRPAFSSLVGDSEGFLWVRPYRPPPDQPEPWLVLDPSEGRILGEVRLPTGLRPLEIGTDYLLGWMSNELDVELVQLLRLTR